MSQAALIRLVYASRRHAAPRRTGEAEVQDILIASIRNNRANAITGLLLTHDDWFMQVLEGPPGAVMQTFDRIAADHRHTDTVVRATTEPPARSFRRWTMCAQDFSEVDQAIVAGLLRGRAFDPFQCNDAEALSLLRQVAAAHGEALSGQHLSLGERASRAA